MPSYDKDARLTSPEAIAFFATVGQTITKQAIYSWRKHGLRVIGYNPRRQPLYRFGDLLDAERRSRTNPKSTRHPSRRAARDRAAA